MNLSSSALRGRVVPVLLAATVLVGGANLASYAANGKPLLLGKANSATKTTTLRTTGTGPALSLRSKAGKPPLAVSNATKVVRLNADKVDGLEGAALQNKIHVYDYPSNVITSATVAKSLIPGLPKGRYLASYSITGIGSTTAAQLSCYLRVGDGPFELNSTAGTLDSAIFALSSVNATGYLDTRGGGDVSINCYADSGTVTTTQPNATRSQITFTRVDTVTNGQFGN